MKLKINIETHEMRQGTWYKFENVLSGYYVTSDFCYRYSNIHIRLLYDWALKYSAEKYYKKSQEAHWFARSYDCYLEAYQCINIFWVLSCVFVLLTPLGHHLKWK